MIRSRLVLISLLPLALACVHNVNLTPTIQPNAFAGREYPGRVAVVFSQEIPGYIAQATPSTLSGSAHSYNFTVGATLSAALLRAVDVAYADVVSAATQPAAGEYERIIKFSIANSNLNVRFDDNFFTVSANAQYAISLSIEAYDGRTLTLLRRSTISGNGFSARNNSGVYNAEQQFGAAVEAGIQQLVDNAANVLISGFAEPQGPAAPAPNPPDQSGLSGLARSIREWLR